MVDYMIHYKAVLKCHFCEPLHRKVGTPIHTSHTRTPHTNTHLRVCPNIWWGSGLIIHRTSLHPCSPPALMTDHPLPYRRGEWQAYLRGRRAAREWLDSRSSGAMAMWQHTFPFGWKIWLMWLTRAVCVCGRERVSETSVYSSLKLNAKPPRKFRVLWYCHSAKRAMPRYVANMIIRVYNVP